MAAEDRAKNYYKGHAVDERIMEFMKIGESKKKKVIINAKVKDITWNTAGNLFYYFGQWIITVLVVWLSSYENAGYLSLAMSTSGTFSAIALFGVRNYQVSDVQGEYTTEEYVGSRIWTCFIAFLLCSLFSINIGSIYQMLCINAYMLIRVAEAFVDVLQGVEQIHSRYNYIGKSYIIRGILTVCVFVFGICATNNLAIVLYLIAISNLLFVILYDYKMVCRLERFEIEWKGKHKYSLLKKCLPIVVFSFLLNLVSLIPRIVLQQYVGVEEFGIYVSIASPVSIVQIASLALFTPFIPMLSRYYDSDSINQFRVMINKLYAAIFLSGMLIVTAMLLFGKVGLAILFGRDILQQYQLFMPLVCCAILIVIVWVGATLLTIIREIGYILKCIVVALVICMSSVTFFVKKYGENGASYIQIISLVICVVLMLVIFEIKIRDVMKGKKS